MSKKPDRRVLRTRRQLREALLDLVLHRGFDDLTVTDITDHATLRRATFYLHYPTKEALLLDALQRENQSLFEQIETNTPLPDLYRLTFEHIAAHADLYTALMKSTPGALVTHQLQQQLIDHLTVNHPEITAHHIAGSLASIMQWWLLSGMTTNPKTIAKKAYTLLQNGIPAP